jgi:hypothetical protein
MVTIQNMSSTAPETAPLAVAAPAVAAAAAQSTLSRFLRDLPTDRSQRSRRPTRAAMFGNDESSEVAAPVASNSDDAPPRRRGTDDGAPGASPLPSGPSLITSARDGMSSSSTEVPQKRPRGPDKATRVSASFVHCFFERVDGDTYRCKLGAIHGQSHQDLVKQTSGTGTSNLLSHLEHRHSEEFVHAKEHDDPQAYAQGVIRRNEDIRRRTSSMLRARESRTGATSTLLEILLAAAFVTAGLAFSFIENPFFTAFLSLLNFHVPSRSTFVNLVNMLTAVIYSHRRQELRSVAVVSLTADGWSDCRRRRYIGVTAHWVTPDWVTHQCFLTAIPFPLSHTGDAIAKAIHERVEGEFGADTLILSKFHTRVMLS